MEILNVIPSKLDNPHVVADVLYKYSSLQYPGLGQRYCLVTLWDNGEIDATPTYGTMNTEYYAKKWLDPNYSHHCARMFSIYTCRGKTDGNVVKSNDHLLTYFISGLRIEAKFSDLQTTHNVKDLVSIETISAILNSLKGNELLNYCNNLTFKIMASSTYIQGRKFLTLKHPVAAIQLLEPDHAVYTYCDDKVEKLMDWDRSGFVSLENRQQFDKVYILDKKSNIVDFILIRFICKLI